jgi:hypothetical protein
VIATEADADAVVSAALRAVTVCVPGPDGGLYTPELLIVPTDPLPPLIESTSQTTAVLLTPVTVAVKVCCWRVVSAARFGLMLTFTDPLMTAVIVNVAEAVLVVSATDFAVNVIVAGFGTLAGPV